MKAHLDHLKKFRYGEEEATEDLGRNGVFVIPLQSESLRKETVAICISNDGTETGWEHVSVAMGYDVGKKRHGGVRQRPPSVEELDVIKRQFWDDDEQVAIYFSSEMGRVTDAMGDVIVHLWKPGKQTLLQRILGKNLEPPTDHLIPKQEDIDRAAQYDAAVARAQEEAKDE